MISFWIVPPPAAPGMLAPDGAHHHPERPEREADQHHAEGEVVPVSRDRAANAWRPGASVDRWRRWRRRDRCRERPTTGERVAGPERHRTKLAAADGPGLSSAAKLKKKVKLSSAELVTIAVTW